MTVENLDYGCYESAVKSQREHQEDWLSVGYAPCGFYLKDFCIYQHGDVFHLFHIAGAPGVSCCLPGNEIWFGHATTRDFQTWETHVPCFYIQPEGDWDAGHVFAPYVVKCGDGFRMFYTGCAIDNTQRIGAAESVDLFRWHRVGHGPLIRPDEYGWAFCPTSGGSACRDPHVAMFDDCWHLYYTAVTLEGRGCVARASSADLTTWRDEGVAYQFGGLNHCESSNVQQQGDRFLLFFGGHHEYWSYVVSDNPYHWPDQAPIPLAHRITAMEVVKRKGDRWLTAYFKMDNLRLFLGVVDWADAAPSIRELTSVTELSEFGF